MSKPCPGRPALGVRRLLAVLVCSLALPLPATAGNLNLTGVVPGGSMMRKEVVSVREARFTDLVRQSLDYSCGAAALATILKYFYNVDTDEEQVLQGLLQVSNPQEVMQKGFSLLNVKHYVGTLGLRAHGYRVTPEKLLKLSIPVMVLLNIRGYQHFVVLKKVDLKKAYIADPALGNKIMPIGDFVESWNGVVFALVSDDVNWESPLLRPAPPLQASRQGALNQALQRVRPIDFGMLHFKLF